MSVAVVVGLARFFVVTDKDKTKSSYELQRYMNVHEMSVEL